MMLSPLTWLRGTRPSGLLSLFATTLLLAGPVLASEPAAPQERAKREHKRKQIEELVQLHARAWETGDVALFERLLHPDIVFAYPGGRLDREQTLAAFVDFARLTRDTRVYVRRVLVDGDEVAVEWQFATTDRQTGKRSAVSDGIIARVVDGKFILWKEYFDLSVSALQADGTLQLEEGEEPFPWPLPVSP